MSREERIQKANGEGQKDGSKNTYDPPFDGVIQELIRTDTDTEVKHAYKAGWRNAKDNRWE